MKVTVTNEKESVIYNGVIYRNGDSFEVEDAIGESLMDRGYVSSAESVEEADLQTGYLDERQLQAMPYPELKRLAAQKGVDATGKKDELIARIRAAENAPEEVEEEEAEAESADDLPNTDMPE